MGADAAKIKQAFAGRALYTFKRPFEGPAPLACSATKVPQTLLSIVAIIVSGFAGVVWMGIKARLGQ